MRTIHYNLAGTRKIDVRAFALTAAVIFLAAVVFNGITIFNLARQQRQSRAEKNEVRLVVQKIKELKQKTQQQKIEIAAWGKKWKSQLNAANFMIERKCFSFISRLNFLEKVCSGSMRIRQLKIVNEPVGRIQMTINALAQNELLGLYKKLLPYGLVITNENQTAENYQARLSFWIKDEKN